MAEACNHDCSHCASNCASRESESLLIPANALSEVGHVIGIVSGKGGVGKSLVTSMLAVLLQREGLKVGILDADVTGPSIPKAFGLGNVEVYGDDNGMIPPSTTTGIDMMSVNLLLNDETKPVVWRGSLIASTVQQFWKDTIWNADVLLVDCPPGTGDVPLTVFQSLPLDGIVIVSSPQELVSMIVSKAANMADMMHIPVLGLVENMSYVKCPDCGREIKVFGESHIEEVAKKF
ncbi:MAG: Mrp/NBP35 family ATP-binding protein, partial [Clostridia bacterium]|nr:Mrp/NBP35 family ATP-binding protein [Clostridia bacterium]